MATSILTVTGTCRWTGYDFAVITIDTGYLNRPNWLLADYSFYHRVASQGFPAHNVYDRPAVTAPATVRAGRNSFFYECMMIHSSIESPSVPVQGMHMKVLINKVHCILCAERFETGSGYHPQRPPPPGPVER